MAQRTVLVVDDSALIRQQLSNVLGGAGLKVVEAGNGIDGLDRVAEHRPSLVLLDVLMPRMNGLEMLERLRENPDYHRVPVLMLTAEVEPAMLQRAREAGARGWMVKPVKPDDLLETVLKIAAPAE